MSTLEDALCSVFVPGVRVGVAYSGGRDSTALIHAAARVAARTPGATVVGLHVHHGISARADDWVAHARKQCDDWAAVGLPVTFVHHQVVLGPLGGRSLEAVAREARYEALSDMARAAGVKTVLLAHHRRDQAETLLLQALRGGGVAGLAAMPREVARRGVRWVRPWLDQARESLGAYLDQQALSFIDDESNADERFDRNRLRLQVWPTLVAAFPQAEQALAASARHLADANDCLDEWQRSALGDVTAAATQAARSAPDDEQGSAQALDVRRWVLKPEPQRRELLRAWYRQQSGGALSASWTHRLAAELPALLSSGKSATWGGLGLRLYRGRLEWEDEASSFFPKIFPKTPTPDECGAKARAWHIQSTGLHELPGWNGCLRVEALASGGVALSLLAAVELADRLGGEQFQLAVNRPPRALKKQYQALGVPAWSRTGPMIYVGEQLIFVPGLGMDARAKALTGEPRVGLVWVPGLKSRV